MTPVDFVMHILWTLATGHSDAALLKQYADSAYVPAVVVWAVAYQESRHNVDPALRGWHCRGKRSCEVGRMQVLPSTARAVCPALDIFTYDGNVRCALRLLRSLYERHGSWEQAIRAYQCPRCARETEYQRNVLTRIGKISLRLVELQP